MANQSVTIVDLNDSVSDLKVEADLQRNATVRLRKSLQVILIIFRIFVLSIPAI